MSAAQMMPAGDVAALMARWHFRADMTDMANQGGDDRAEWIALSKLADSEVDWLLTSGLYDQARDGGWTASDLLAAVERLPLLPQIEPCPNLTRRTRGKGKATLALEAAILEVVARVEGPMSPRQVYYECVSHHSGLVKNSAADCDRVERLLVSLREDGRVDDERIVDRGRAKHHRQGWDSARELLEANALHYRQNMWTTQPAVPMVSIEKHALEGVFSAAVDPYGVSLWALHGGASRSFAYEWSKEIRAHNDAGQDVAILYFGDWDPTGLDIERAVRVKLDSFGARYTWTRLGLLPEDFERFGLVELPVKMSDNKAGKFIAKHGPRCAELDALPPDELQRRVKDTIEPLIDVEAWNRLARTAEAERESLNLVVGNWDAALAAAQGAA